MAEPLTIEHKAQIDDLLSREKDVNDVIARAEAAGVDVGERKAQFKEAIKRIKQIRGAFFPNS